MTNQTTTRRLERRTSLAEAVLKAFGLGKTEQYLLGVLHGQPMDLDETEAGFKLRLYGIETARYASATGAVVTWARLATEDPEIARRRAFIQDAIRDLGIDASNPPAAEVSAATATGRGLRPAPGLFVSRSAS